MMVVLCPGPATTATAKSAMTTGRHLTAVHLLAANLLLGVLAAAELERDDDF